MCIYHTHTQLLKCKPIKLISPMPYPPMFIMFQDSLGHIAGNLPYSVNVLQL